MGYIVYAHTCVLSGKTYVGITKRSIERRWSEHVALAFDDRKFELGKLNAFQFAIRKYGDGAWVHSILQGGIGTLNEACDAEIEWIKDLETMLPNGYNGTSGGRGVELTPEGRERHARATKEALNRPDVKARLCESQRRAHNEPECKERNSKAQKIAQNRDDVAEKKRIGMNEFYSSRPVGWRHPRSKRVRQYDEERNLLATYDSACQASRATGVMVTHICEVARGLRPRAGGFVWKYVEEVAS